MIAQGKSVKEEGFEHVPSVHSELTADTTRDEAYEDEKEGEEEDTHTRKKRKRGGEDTDHGTETHKYQPAYKLGPPLDEEPFTIT
jgi:hypothetical protein